MDIILIWGAKIAKFAVLLGVLIFVHELGHFLVARWNGVYVKKFFLGFDIGGLKIFSFRGRETEYGIGILPLGGYVKMVGQEDIPIDKDEAGKKPAEEDEDKDIPPQRRFDHKSVRQRAAIVAAGPIMNLLLGLAVFILVAFIGIRIPDYLSRAEVGMIIPDLPAAESGLKPGDLIMEVDGEPVEEWNDLRWLIMKSEAGKPIDILYRRDDRVSTTRITPEKFRGSPYTRIGVAPKGPVVLWRIRPDTQAADRLRPGDSILAVDGRPLFAPDLAVLLADYSAEEVALTVSRPATEGEIEVVLPVETIGFIPGLELEDLRVDSVDYRAPETVRQLKKGDRIIAADGEEITGEELSALIATASEGEVISLTVHRAGWMFFKPSRDFTVEVPIEELRRVAGIGAEDLTYGGREIITRYTGWKAVSVGWRMSLDSATKLIEVFYRLIAGKMSASGVLSGPIAIFQITGAVQRLSDFLSLLALISINLAVINLFPLPVLDGGHLLFFGIEAVFRRPLSPRVMMIAQQIGLFLIIALLLLVTYNDLIKWVLRY